MSEVKVFGVRCYGCQTKRDRGDMKGWEWYNERPYCPSCLRQQKAMARGEMDLTIRDLDQ